MTAVALPVAKGGPVAGGSVLWRLAGLEVRRYARHPLFLVGAVGTLAIGMRPDPVSSTYFNVIVPAAALGILGLVAMASLTRGADLLGRSAGAAPVPERVQTGALALAALLPFAVGLVWFAWNAYLAFDRPPPPSGFPFGDVSTGWKLAVLFGCGALSTLGGPLLGIVIGRWWPRRGVAPMLAVALVAATIIMQGLFEPLRRVRLFMPFTYFGGPFGTEADPERVLLFPGSPQWWVGYLVCLCGLAVVAALWHDRSARDGRLRTTGLVLAAAAVATCLLATLTGLDHTLVNPLSS